MSVHESCKRRIVLDTQNQDAGLVILDPEARERIRISVDANGVAMFRGSLTDSNHHLAPVRSVAVLPKKYTLPGAQRQATAFHRHGQTGLGEQIAHVRRHVIRPLGPVRIARVAVRRQVADERLQVPEHIGVGILGDRERGGCVLYEQVAEACFDPGCPHFSSDLAGDFRESPAGSFYVQSDLVHPLWIMRFRDRYRPTALPTARARFPGRHRTPDRHC